jgi:hypothetical protein
VKKQKNIELDFEIDRLTNSIQNVITGDSFPTDITLITIDDLKFVTKKMVGFLIGNLNINNPQEMFIN